MEKKHETLNHNSSPLKKPSSSSIKWRNLEEFLKSHIYKKGTHPYPTHTRITNETEGIPGGSFYISDEELPLFHEFYVNHVFVKKSKAHFTEKQHEKGPILVDLDFRYALEVNERQHNEQDVIEIRNLYLEELKQLYQFDESVCFDFIVMQKPHVNSLVDKKITKDGIHFVISLPAKRNVQLLLRNRVLEKIKNSEEGLQLPLINSWEDVFDESISRGKTNWQMYGSCKPGHEAYQITHWFHVNGFQNDEFQIQFVDTKTIDMKRDFAKVSAQTISDYEPFLKLEAARELAAMEEEETNGKTLKKSSSLQGNQDENNGMLNMLRMTMNNTMSNMGVTPYDVLHIKNHDELQECLARFTDSTPLDQYVQIETYDYLMMLPPSYYEQGSYLKWMRAGWALRNLDPVKMFLPWVAFSAQAKHFQFSSIHEMWDKWNKPEEIIGKSGGLTWRSIMYWAKQENIEEFTKIKNNSISYFLDKTLDQVLLLSPSSDKNPVPAGCGDYDIATMLYQLKKGEYVCTSVKSSQWYHFEKNRWIENDSGTFLRSAISTELRQVYFQKMIQINAAMTDMADDDPRREGMQKRLDKVLNIHSRLGKTNDKKNIMTEAKELFYNRDFQKNIDANPYLMGFNNGVYDFKEKTFREGRPEDYLTKSTNIDYVKFDPNKHGETAKEIEEFMSQLFPIPELKVYMWEHLASVLIGVSYDQTFHNYLGVGNNGKSVLVKLMEKTLGDYKVDLTTEFLTSPKPKIGGVSPELVKLRGARYVCMSEPTKGAVIYEGPMKLITSGLEQMEARAPFMTEMVEFVPQCKLIMMTNYLVDVHAQDEGTWRRIRVVDFLSWFTNDIVQGNTEKPYQFKKDPNITEKFDSWKTVFMSMLVEKVLVTGGRVKDCEMVNAASNNYRKTQDVISEFVNERVTKEPGAILRKAQVNFEFSTWHQNTYGNKGPKSKEVHDAITKMYFKPKSFGWEGLKLKTESYSMAAAASSSNQMVEEEDMEDVNLVI